MNDGNFDHDKCEEVNSKTRFRFKSSMSSMAIGTLLMKARLLEKPHRIMMARKGQILAIDQSHVFTPRSRVRGTGFVKRGLVFPGKNGDIYCRCS